MTQPDATPGTRRLGAVALALLVAGAALAGFVVHAQLPANAVSLPFEESARTPVRQILPQGWAMFTRNPREQDVLAFVRSTDGGWHSALRGPHSQPHNAFGFNRASRTQGVEIATMTTRLTAEQWQECRRGIPACIERAVPVPMDNPSLDPTLCGDVGFAGQVPVPWAWSGSDRTISMPAQVVRLVVTC
ncbi:SdpA family antimicrobial peptide system protein [Plantactinospora endophytica]|uniref:SdpA family antimicrobial peptide system protein n=1 Tax=Plantactinospora endophytica TaxID=673535 RepID=A0ABQ4EBX0_9ACTN|nr:SdpA family antimicrobial peptide system protein [Plantactinospora endophytica]GIG92218.1 hypothetical protein Pen02_71540 [Plantactinospora endophytica]